MNKKIFILILVGFTNQIKSWIVLNLSNESKTVNMGWSQEAAGGGTRFSKYFNLLPTKVGFTEEPWINVRFGREGNYFQGKIFDIAIVTKENKIDILKHTNENTETLELALKKISEQEKKAEAEMRTAFEKNLDELRNKSVQEREKPLRDYVDPLLKKYLE